MADIEISKIILRRGPAFDLPGKPIKLFPRQWSKPLDEAEVAFAGDQGRLFIGADPTKDLKNNQRLPFPYQNVEVIGENSVDAFAGLHGERMREGASFDYYSAPLYPTAKPELAQQTWRTVNIDGDEACPYFLTCVDAVSAFVDYTINDQFGYRVRYGRQYLQFFYNPLALPGEVGTEARPFLIDEAETVRVPEQDPTFHPEYDPGESVGQIGFRFTLVDEGVEEPQLRFEYRNYTPDTYSIRWKMTRP